MQTLVRDIDGFERFAQAKNGKAEEALRALFTEVIRVERHGITASELERARSNFARALSEAAEQEATTDSREFTDEITRFYFAHELMIGRVAERDLTNEILPKITLDELNQLAKKFGGADNRAILISGKDGAQLPTKERVLAIVDEVQKADVPAWEDKAPTQALMKTPPTPGKVVKETKIDKIDVTEWTLSNGVKVVVKPTDYELDSVEIEGSSPGGEAMAKDKDYPDARWADEVVAIGGIGDFDSESLTKALAGKQARVFTAISDTEESIGANGSAHDLETMMQLIYLKMTAPRKDPQMFSVWKANFVEQLGNALNSPEVKFGRAVQAELWKHNLRRTPPEPADLEKIDLDKALAFYKDRYGDATDFTFVIVGAVDLAKLKPLVETYLASLPAKGRKEKEKDLGIRKVGGVVKKEWKFGSEPKASVRLDFHGDDTWTRDKDRDMFILGQVLSIELRQTLREDLGGVYGVGASGHIERSPHQSRDFSIRFGCDPKRVDELIKAAFAEIDKLEKDGATDEDLEKVKQTFLRTRETELRKNGFWSGWLATSYRFGDDPTIVLDPSKMTARMTSANVKASAKRYLDPKTYFQAVLVPEK
jgi:zinc protease